VHKWLGVILFCVTTLSAPAQTPSPKYQPGTIMAVTAHQSPGQHDGVTQYDLSLKVGKTTYVVLYTPLNGANTVTYALGDELLVLPGSKTLAIDTPSGKVEAPILREETLPAQGLDPSKAASQDFSVKLALSDAQEAEVRPLLEQEAGQVGQVCTNPELSRAAKLSQYGNIVRASDEQIKPLLSASQVQKLRDLRREQKQDVKRMIAEQKSGKQD
jgi:hypothetical protein